MTFEKLNNAYRQYKEEPSESNFQQLYKEAKSEFLLPNRGKMLNMGYSDPNDADSVFNDAIWKAIQKEDPIENFGLWIRTSLKNERLDFLKLERRRRKRVSHYLDEHPDEGNSAPKLVLKTDNEEVENEVFRSEEKKRTNQRQLVSSLLEPLTVLSDPLMTDIIQRVKLGENPGAIAKSHGLDRNTVVRKLHNLSRNYDRNIYGDIAEYLPIGLRVRSEFLSA